MIALPRHALPNNRLQHTGLALGPKLLFWASQWKILQHFFEEHLLSVLLLLRLTVHLLLSDIFCKVTVAQITI